MATLTIDVRSTRPTARWLGVLLLSTALSFLAGRATAARHPSTPPAPAQAGPRGEAQPAEPPPWATHGFRDTESVQDACATADCSG